MKNRDGTKQFFVELDEDVRASLLRAAAKANRSLNELVVIALADEFGVKYVGNGYPFQPERVTGTTGKRTFWMPVSIKNELAHRAIDEGVSQKLLFNETMRGHYGRKRKGGRKK